MNLKREILPTKKLWINNGQINGLPQNPRFIKDARFYKLVKSIRDNPEFLKLREIIVLDWDGDYIVLCGNMRYRAAVECGIIEVPCKILSEDTPIEFIREIVIKDNIAFGQDDTDILANEWDQSELEEWGMEISWTAPSDSGPVDNGLIEDVESDYKPPKAYDFEVVIQCEDSIVHDKIKTEVQEMIRSYEGVKIK